MLSGGTWAAIELCSNNIQMEVAPLEHPSTYAIAAAVAGVCGALGTTAGGIIAQVAHLGGLPGLFALCCAIGRSVTLLFVREPRSQPLVQVLRSLLGLKGAPH